MEGDKPLLFAGADSYLSNFSAYPITLRNKVWPTTEHYFQAQKFAGTEVEDLIRDAKTPSEAKHLGAKQKLRPNWEDIKEQIMYEALLAKFTQHADLRTKLIETGTCQIIENKPSDLYWGSTPEGGGQNRLGILLMEVRAFLKRLGPDEVPQIRVFEESDPTTKKVFITAEAQFSVRRQKAKARRNVWKDQAGVSLFELENDRSGTASLVGSNNVKVPLNALPSKAKFVAKQYQFDKRFEANSDDFSESEDYEEDEESHKSVKSNMGDYIPPQIVRTAKTCFDEVVEKLELLAALEEGDQTRDFIFSQCQNLQKEMIDFIQQGQEEETMMDLLCMQLDSLNTVLEGSKA